MISVDSVAHTSMAGQSRAMRRTRKSSKPVVRSSVIMMTKPEIRKKSWTPALPANWTGMKVASASPC